MITECDHPQRGDARGKVKFVKLGGSASVRLALKKRSHSDGISILELADGKQLFLNLIDFEFYDDRLLHADHWRASVELIDKQTELVEAMNLNPALRDRMMKANEGLGYFIVKKDGCVVGSYWFYMLFHNAVEVVWFLIASANVGAKGAVDPVHWLKSFKLGTDFLAYLSAADLQLNPTDLLYTLSDGRTLKDAFVEWVMREKKPNIKTAKVFKKLHGMWMDPVRADATVKSMRLMRQKARISMFNIQSASARGSESPSSVDDSGASDSEGFDNEVGAAMANDPETKDLERQVEVARKQKSKEVKKARAKRKARQDPGGSSDLGSAGSGRSGKKPKYG